MWKMLPQIQSIMLVYLWVCVQLQQITCSKITGCFWGLSKAASVHVQLSGTSVCDRAACVSLQACLVLLRQWWKHKLGGYATWWFTGPGSVWNSTVEIYLTITIEFIQHYLLESFYKCFGCHKSNQTEDTGWTVKSPNQNWLDLESSDKPVSKLCSWQSSWNITQACYLLPLVARAC